jgi:hypothetical protein
VESAVPSVISAIAPQLHVGVALETERDPVHLLGARLVSVGVKDASIVYEPAAGLTEPSTASGEAVVAVADL